MSQIIATTDVSFTTDVLQSETLVLVDFWAEWCSPCKMIAPMLDALASEYGDKIRICKVNIDENPESPTKFGVRGIPTLLLFKGGELQATKVGALPKQALSDWIASHL